MWSVLAIVEDLAVEDRPAGRRFENSATRMLAKRWANAGFLDSKQAAMKVMADRGFLSAGQTLAEIVKRWEESRRRRGGRSTIDRDRGWLTRFESEVRPLFESDGHALRQGSNDNAQVESRNEQIAYLIWLLTESSEVPSDWWTNKALLPARVDTVDRALRRAERANSPQIARN
jgi:hypothetical protein